MLLCSLAACHAADVFTPETRRPIDFHVHLDAEAVPTASRVLTEAGIAGAVVLSALPYGPEWLALRDRLRASAVPLIPFCGVDWRQLDAPDFGSVAADTLRRAVAAGCRGLKIPKVLGLRLRRQSGGLVAIDDPALDPVWETAGELGVPVAIHTGDPAAFFRPFTPDNERYEELATHPSWRFYDSDAPSLATLLAARDRVVARHPRTTFVAVHVGGFPENLRSVGAAMQALPNLWIDLAARLPEIGRRPPAEVRELLLRFTNRVLFGTDLQIDRLGIVLGAGDTAHGLADALRYYDVHWRYLESSARGIVHLTPIQGRWPIDGVALPTPVLTQIYRDNARRLLALP